LTNIQQVSSDQNFFLNFKISLAVASICILSNAVCFSLVNLGVKVILSFLSCVIGTVNIHLFPK